ncbi:Periostin [Madurella mycetomatis]|uniref:Periostin n=1 Tax=Madurella mycetomatis TaxID=100816 RepID=A0A175VS86_9PEZI|nr:Periostin [Madurella mycetomatis]
MRPNDLIGLLALGASQALAQSLLEVLQDNGFSGYAELLEGDAILSAGPGLIVYAPSNAALSAAADLLPAREATLPRNNASNSFGAVRNTAPTFVDPALYPEDGDAGDAEAPPGAVRETLLEDPVFTNLGPGHNQSLVEKNVSSAARPTVHSGLGRTVEVTGDDIAFDGGVVRPIDGVLTLPSSLSTTLPLVDAGAFAAALQRAGLAMELDNRPSITVLAPNDDAWNEAGDLPEDQLAQLCKEHVIVDFPGYTPLLKNGGTYQTLGQTNVTISVQGEEISIGGSKIVKSDAIIINGVVHTIDKVG